MHGCEHDRELNFTVNIKACQPASGNGNSADDACIAAYSLADLVSAATRLAAHWMVSD